MKDNKKRVSCIFLREGKELLMILDQKVSYTKYKRDSHPEFNL
jgi:hypothetical protein